jgi:hypothetical protein
MATDIVTVHATDAYNLPYTIPIYIPAGSTLANIQSMIDSVVLALDSVTGGLIGTVTVELNLTVPAACKDAAVAATQREMGCAINFETGEREGYPLNIPGIDVSLIDGDDITYAGAVAAFISAMVAGAATVLPCDQSGKDLTGYRTVKKSKRKF